MFSSACVKLALLFSLASALPEATAVESKPRVAVFEFDDLSAPTRSDGPAWQQLTALLLSRALEATDQVQVVDRWRLQEIVDSLVLADVGVIDRSAVSKQMNADFMVLGDFNQIVPGRFIVNLRVQNAADGALVPKGADNREIGMADLSSFVSGASLKLIGALQLEASKSAHKSVNAIGSRSVAALEYLGQALVNREHKEYAKALLNLDSARQADKHFEEIDRQIAEISALLDLQKRLITPEQK